MKSPLKNDLCFSTKALAEIKKIIPKNSIVETYAFYDGDLELNLSHSERLVISHTNKHEVYNFWRCLMEAPGAVRYLSENIYNSFPPEMLEFVQGRFQEFTDDAYNKAGIFFVLNRCSENGKVSYGKIDKTLLNPIHLSYLEGIDFSNFHLIYDKELDFIDSIHPNEKTDYVILNMGNFHLNLFEDGKNIGIEETIFNHRHTIESMKRLNKKWLLIYKYHPTIIKKYSQNMSCILLNQYGFVTNKENEAKEILLGIW